MILLSIVNMAIFLEQLGPTFRTCPSHTHAHWLISRCYRYVMLAIHTRGAWAEHYLYNTTAAGGRQARGLFAALATDAGNVFVTLTAKELNPALHVVARAETERSERTLLRSGADKVISPYAMGGHRMAQAALRPAVVDIIDLATHHQSLELQLEEINVPVSSPCNGMALRDSGLWEQPGVIVVAIKRASGKMLFNPVPGEKIEAGDSLIALAEAPQLKAIERRVRGGHE
jgi:voltage-gated potassium channel